MRYESDKRKNAFSMVMTSFFLGFEAKMMTNFQENVEFIEFMWIITSFCRKLVIFMRSTEFTRKLLSFRWKYGIFYGDIENL